MCVLMNRVRGHFRKALRHGPRFVCVVVLEFWPRGAFRLPGRSDLAIGSCGKAGFHEFPCFMSSILQTRISDFILF